MQARLERACRRAGRDAAEVTLVAVSKTRSGAEMREAMAAGLRHFGENRVQEAAAKVAADPDLAAAATLHLVGHLQLNKAAAAARLFRCIHSLDRAELFAAVARHARRPIEMLVQVHLGGEPTKHGIAAQMLGDLLAAAAATPLVRVTGLMALPPYTEDPADARPYFRQLRELRDAHGGRDRLPQLSMGMSHDFEVAVEEGATLIRVGEAIFGPRARPEVPGAAP